MIYENKKTYYAKQIPLTELVSNAGYTPIRNGSVFILKEHDSFVIFPETNSFCHYSQVDGNGYVGGTTIDFCMKYMGMSFKESVDYLCNMSNVTVNIIEHRKVEKNKLVLPEKNSNNKRVIAYLCKTRGIDIEVVNYFIKCKRLYESTDNHNCVFVTYDKEKNPVYAFLRSTNTSKSFKLDVCGSDKSEAFPIYKKGSKKVIAFEAPIDLLSFMTMYHEDESSLISLGCLSPKGLYKFLEKYDEINTVSLILDNDEPGIKATEKIGTELQERGYSLLHHELLDEMKESEAKDVNDYLINIYNPLIKITKMKLL